MARPTERRRNCCCLSNRQPARTAGSCRRPPLLCIARHFHRKNYFRPRIQMERATKEGCRPRRPPELIAWLMEDGSGSKSRTKRRPRRPRGLGNLAPAAGSAISIRSISRGHIYISPAPTHTVPWYGMCVPILPGGLRPSSTATVRSMYHHSWYYACVWIYLDICMYVNAQAGKKKNAGDSSRTVVGA